MGPIIIVAGQNQRSKFTVFGRHVGRVKMSQLVLARRRTSDMSRDELIVYYSLRGIPVVDIQSLLRRLHGFSIR